jgi:hypothetical protein
VVLEIGPQKENWKCGKYLRKILMTVMMFSGCSVAKNLENPRSKPNPKVYGVISFGHRFYKEEAGEVLCYVLGRYIILYYCPLQGGQNWFDRKIFNKPKFKEIRGSIPRGAQDLPLLAIGND